jgi:hypothetical protein
MSGCLLGALERVVLAEGELVVDRRVHPERGVAAVVVVLLDPDRDVDLEVAKVCLQLAIRHPRPLPSPEVAAINSSAQSRHFAAFARTRCGM